MPFANAPATTDSGTEILALIGANFDPEFYCRRYPDVAKAKVDALQHFLQAGQNESRLPCAWFDPRFYLRTIPASRHHEFGPFGHYLEQGRAEGLAPSAEFRDYANPRIAAYVKWLFSRAIDRKYYETILPGNEELPLLEFLLRDRALEFGAPVPELTAAAIKEIASSEPAYGWHIFHLHLATRIFKESQEKLFLEFSRIVAVESGRYANLKEHVWHDFYLSYNGVPEAAVPNAFEHYFGGGWLDEFDPNPNFSSAYYLREQEDVARAGINPLAHYIEDGLHERRMASPVKAVSPDASANDLLQRMLMNLKHSGPDSEPVDALEYRNDVCLVVPIYKAIPEVRELLRCLAESVSPEQGIVLVDDCSGEPVLTQLLQEWSSLRPGASVISLARNGGFSRACNVGIEHARGRHVIIINSDTMPPKGWLGRIMRPIDVDVTVGSVTPFSNTSSVSGFPDRQSEAANYLALPREEIDRVVAALPPAEIDLVSGSGFFLAMRREALKAIGGLDSETFKVGYYEDTDWCERASQAGFRNVLAPNLYVYHKPGSASFTVADRNRLSEGNRLPFTRKHPSFQPRLRAESRADPAASYRKAAKVGCWLTAARQIVLQLEHGWGGGASDVVQSESRRALADGDCVIRLVGSPSLFSLQFAFGDEVEGYDALSLGAVAIILSTLAIASFEVHASHSLASPPAVLQHLFDALGERARVRFYLHDFFIACPSAHLIDWRGVYCRLPAPSMCFKCLPRNPNAMSYASSVASWRKKWEETLRRAEALVVFDRSGAEIVREAFQGLDLPQILISPHEPHVAAAESPKRNRSRPRGLQRVAFCGAMRPHKGSSVVRSILRWAKHSRPELEFTLFGEWLDGALPANLKATGKYQAESLPMLLVDNDIDVVIFTSVCPETFSFTLTEIFASGVPCVGFDFGAQATRIRGYELGMVLDSFLPGDIIDAADSLLGAAGS